MTEEMEKKLMIELATCNATQQEILMLFLSLLYAFGVRLEPYQVGLAWHDSSMLLLPYCRKQLPSYKSYRSHELTTSFLSTCM